MNHCNFLKKYNSQNDPDQQKKNSFLLVFLSPPYTIVRYDCMRVRLTLFSLLTTWCMLLALLVAVMAIRKQAELGRDSNVHPHGRTGLLRFDQVKNDFFSAQLNMLSEHVRSDYGHEYFIAFWNTIAKFFEKHANPYPEQVCLV